MCEPYLNHLELLSVSMPMGYHPKFPQQYCKKYYSMCCKNTAIANHEHSKFQACLTHMFEKSQTSFDTKWQPLFDKHANSILQGLLEYCNKSRRFENICAL